MTKKPAPEPFKGISPDDAALIGQLVQLGLENLSQRASVALSSIPVEQPEPKPEVSE